MGNEKSVQVLVSGVMLSELKFRKSHLVTCAGWVARAWDGSQRDQGGGCWHSLDERRGRSIFALLYPFCSPYNLGVWGQVYTWWTNKIEEPGFLTLRNAMIALTIYLDSCVVHGYKTPLCAKQCHLEIVENRLGERRWLWWGETASHEISQETHNLGTKT